MLQHYSLFCADNSCHATIPKPPPSAAAADFFDWLAAAADKKIGLAG